VGSSTVEVLTEAMTRLRDEIVSLRRARMAWRGDLVRQVFALRADFASDRAGAHRAWFGPARSGPEPAGEAPHPETRPHVAPSQGQRTSFKPAASFKATPPFKASPAAKTHKKH
jgi:hypothetical protein